MNFEPLMPKKHIYISKIKDNKIKEKEKKGSNILKIATILKTNFQKIGFFVCFLFGTCIVWS